MSRTTWISLLPHLRTRLVKRLVTDQGIVPDSTAIQVTAMDPRKVPHYNAAYEVLVWSREEVNRTEFSDGAGRLDTRSTRWVYVACRTRLDLDMVGSDITKLTDASLGHYRLEAAVKDALAGWTPTVDDTSASGDLTDQPLRWRDTTGTEDDMADPSWVASMLRFEAGYEEDFTQSDPVEDFRFRIR